jgi:CO/xanthine dehydrogenase Mo-binding subunit
MTARTGQRIDSPTLVDIRELPDGLRGVGEPPTISSTPAIAAAIRAAGRARTRGPEHIIDL